MTQAWLDGYKAGKCDRLIGWRSEYVWATGRHEGRYVWEYSLGYKQAFRERVI